MKNIFIAHIIILTIFLYIFDNKNLTFYASIYCLCVVHFFIFYIINAIKEIHKIQNTDREIITKLNHRIRLLEKELYGETKDYYTDSITGAADLDDQNIGKN